jgi:hypothetical protein
MIYGSNLGVRFGIRLVLGDCGRRFCGINPRFSGIRCVSVARQVAQCLLLSQFRGRILNTQHAQFCVLERSPKTLLQTLEEALL